jgi:FtsZ-interacting cell division protein ZipA
MRRAGVIVGILMIVGAYFIGFWPQYQTSSKLRGQLQTATTQLSRLEAQVGLSRLQQDLLGVIRQTSAKNYGDASTLSTHFFNEVSQEEARQTQPRAKAALQSILAQRDVVTSDLAKGDASALGVLNDLENTMFKLLNEFLGESGGSGAE